ncbi:MAG TPA: ATP-binding protein [Vicinamibacteria bacterium]|nr:ATP-binding protein [Vicinamibacteria bacterium]
MSQHLTLMLRTLRLSGLLETLEVRTRQAVEQQASFVDFLTLLLQDEVERRAQSKLRLRLRRAAFDPTKTLAKRLAAKLATAPRPRPITERAGDAAPP